MPRFQGDRRQQRYLCRLLVPEGQLGAGLTVVGEVIVALERQQTVIVDDDVSMIALVTGALAEKLVLVDRIGDGLLRHSRRRGRNDKECGQRQCGEPGVSGHRVNSSGAVTRCTSVIVTRRQRYPHSCRCINCEDRTPPLSSTYQSYPVPGSPRGANTAHSRRMNSSPRISPKKNGRRERYVPAPP